MLPLLSSRRTVTHSTLPRTSVWTLSKPVALLVAIFGLPQIYRQVVSTVEIVSPTDSITGTTTAKISHNLPFEQISGKHVEKGQCATLRLAPSATFRQLSVRPFRVGLEFVEEGFLSRHSRSSGMHFYHFMEFWVVAFAELTELSKKTTGPIHVKQKPVGLAGTSTNIEVPWIFIPRIPEDHICGRLQCLVSQFFFPLSTLSSSDSSSISSPTLEIFGAKLVEDADSASYMMESVDAVLVINRAQCNHATMHKMYANYLSSFDAQQWSKQVQSGIQKLIFVQRTEGGSKEKKRSKVLDFTSALLANENTNGQPRLVVTYIDRQNSFRRLLPTDHRWILSTFTHMQNVSFLHVKMEEYSGEEQLQIASMTDVFIGMHGNGLSHQMFAKPGGTVIEIFWNKDYHYDYYTMALLMEHDYLCIFSGQVVDYFPPRNETYENAVWPLPPPTQTRFLGSFSDRAKDSIIGMIRAAQRQKKMAARSQ